MLKPYPKYKETNVPWLGPIPIHWEVNRAKWLFMKMNRAPLEEDDIITCFRDGIVTLRKHRRVTGFTESLKEIGYQGIRKGDLVIHQMDAFAGAIGVSDSDGKGTPVYSVCEPINKANNTHYYAGIIREMARSEYILSLSRGIRERSTEFRYETFKYQALPLPPPEEQSQIARYLNWKTSRINKFIKAKKRLIELLKEQKQVIINDAVTGKIDVRTGKPYPKYKESGVEWLGMIPEGWNINRLRSFATSNASGVDKISVINEFAVRLCNYIDVYKNNIIDDSLNFMKGTAKEEEISKFRLKEDDVIITKDSETWDDIAVPAYVPKELPDVICAYHLSLIRTSKEKVLGEFLYNSFSSEALLYQFRISANGVTRYGLSQGAIKDGLFAIPSVIEQRAICNYINCMSRIIEKLIEETEKELILIQEYRTGIIADVVTGKVDVRDIKVPEFEEEIAPEEPEEDLAEEPALTDEQDSET
jgi:type I restriction enzyme S subunit